MRLDVKEPQLFSLKEDIAESKDLTKAHPEKVNELLSDWKAWNTEQKPPLWIPPKKAKKGGDAE